MLLTQDELLEELNGGEAAGTEGGGKAPERQLSAKHEVLRALVRGDRSFSRTLSQELNDQLSGLRSASANASAGSPRSPLSSKKRRREGTGLASTVAGSAAANPNNNTQTVSDDAPSMEDVFASIARDRSRSTAQSTLRATASRGAAPSHRTHRISFPVPERRMSSLDPSLWTADGNTPARAVRPSGESPPSGAV